MNYKLRNINANDYDLYKNHIHSEISKEYFEHFVNNVLNLKHQIIVIEMDNQIIGSGTLLIEEKLTYGGCKMGHIENILIDEKYRNLKLGSILVNKLVELAKQNKCYRIDLSCEEQIVDFYEKLGFHKKIVTMIMLNKENFSI